MLEPRHKGEIKKRMKEVDKGHDVGVSYINLLISLVK